MEVLLVEDDAQLVVLLERVLREEGHTLTVCRTLREAEAAVSNGTFDMVVLDWMLPDGDSLDLCARVRSQKLPTSVLMLTARAELQDRVAGLRTGADDYMTKPFEIEELLARIDTIHRRVHGRWVTQVGQLEIDRRTQVVRSGGKRLELTGREYDLIALLSETPNECVSRQTLLADVWNMTFDPGSGVIDVHMSRLRDKLGELAWMVETVRGQGFRLRTDR